MTMVTDTETPELLFDAPEIGADRHRRPPTGDRHREEVHREIAEANGAAASPGSGALDGLAALRPKGQSKA